MAIEIKNITVTYNIYFKYDQLKKVEDFIKQFQQETGVKLSFNKAVLVLIDRGLRSGN